MKNTEPKTTVAVSPEGKQPATEAEEIFWKCTVLVPSISLGAVIAYKGAEVKLRASEADRLAAKFMVKKIRPVA